MKKIMIIGSGGAGKSTLAKQLGTILTIPVSHLDALFWKPGWTPMNRTEFRQGSNEMMKRPEWIIDGNFGSTMDDRINKADTIIFLHYSKYRCILRALKRRIMYHNKTRPDMGEECEEKIDKEFLKWIWHFPTQKAPAILEKLEAHSSEKNIIILRSPRETSRWLKRLETSS